VASRPFVEKVKALLGFRAKGRDVIEGAKGYQRWEVSAQYNALFGAKMVDIGNQNTYLWDCKTE